MGKRTFDWEGVEYGSAEYQRRWRLANAEKSRAYHRSYDKKAYSENPDREAARRQRWTKNNGLKVKTQRRTNYAIKLGILKRSPCQECGTTLGVVAHHPDYNDHLNVLWLCEVHHKEWHRNNTVVEPVLEIVSKRVKFQ